MKNAIIMMSIPKIKYLETFIQVKEYCHKYDIDLKIIDSINNKYTHNIFLQKYQCFDIATSNNYDKILYIDDDVYITDHAPNIFETINTGVAFVPLQYKRFNAGVMLACKDNFSFFDYTKHMSASLDTHFRNSPSKLMVNPPYIDSKYPNPGIRDDQDLFIHTSLTDKTLTINHLHYYWNYLVTYNDVVHWWSKQIYDDKLKKEIQERKESNVSRKDAFFIHYTVYKNLIKEDHICFQNSKKIKMFEEIGIHDTLHKRK